LAQIAAAADDEIRDNLQSSEPPLKTKCKPNFANHLFAFQKPFAEIGFSL
jgi:hypothetical protein